MIRAILQVIEPGIIEEKNRPFEKEFLNEDDLRAWLRRQNEHPFLHMQLLKTEEVWSTPDGK